ncbi:hypothetical protein IMSHALPRED_006117 [Imshaugia aleurites]|uniref:SnoaL-like domain-containing protein n=1 Tax=Imshaugia aleurites TaxID=172621 RepID=A0A8H3FF80_9LECA|nr:hypothetical protein IMSHALPRED_006117 [Imshaugia aleurites]
MCAAGLLPQHIRSLIMSRDIEQISAALHAYQDAFNNSSVEDSVILYTQDGVVMPQHSPSFVGIANVRKAHESFFEIIKFDVKFDIQEIVPISPEYAFARVNSAGTTVIEAHGQVAQANQMLFVFRKVGGEWKIARYCFSTTNPPSK